MQNIGGTSRPGGTGELTATDWQRVMEGLLHPNIEEGRTNLQAAIGTLRKEGKLAAFKSQIQEIESYIQLSEK